MVEPKSVDVLRDLKFPNLPTTIFSVAPTIPLTNHPTTLSNPGLASLLAEGKE